MPPYIFSPYIHLSYTYSSTWKWQEVSVFLVSHHRFSVLALLEMDKNLQMSERSHLAGEKKKKEIALK